MRTAIRIVCILCFLINTACSVTRSPSVLHDEVERCRRSVSVTSPMLVQASENQGETKALPGYPDKVVHIASAMGVLPELQKLEELEQQGNDESTANRVEKLTLHQKLISRLVLIMLEVNSAKAEIQCEEERMVAIADRLQEAENRFAKHLTLSSVIVGGVASLVGGALILLGDTTIPDAVVAITGGIVGSALGATALMDLSDYDLEHQRNILLEVWDGPKNSKIFPPSVWHFLNASREEEGSPREYLVDRWKSRLGISQPAQDQVADLPLLFGEGGEYTLGDLRTRASLLSMLASTIDLFQQDIEEMLRHILLKAPSPQALL